MQNRLFTGRNLTLASIVVALGTIMTAVVINPRHKGMEEIKYLAAYDKGLDDVKDLEEKRRLRAKVRLDELRQIYKDNPEGLQERNNLIFTYEVDAINHMLGSEDDVWSAFYQTESNNYKVDCEDVAIHNSVVDGTFRFLALYDIDIAESGEPKLVNHAVNFGEIDGKFYVTGIYSDYHSPQFNSISDIAVHFGARRAAIWAPIKEEDWIEYAGNVKEKSKVVGFYDLSDRVNDSGFGEHLDEIRELL